MSDWGFLPDVHSRFWSYLANRVSNWPHYFSAMFITLRGSFICFWLVCSSPYYSVLALEIELGTWVGSCKRIWLGSCSPPSGCLPQSFNWYQSELGHSLSLTGFVTRRKHGKRCREARCLQWRGFWLLEKSDSQLSLELRSCHFGDCIGSIRDLSNAWECNPRWVAKVWKQLKSLESHYFCSR
jgi:hypothetical protein